MPKKNDTPSKDFPFGMCVIIFRHPLSFFDFSPFWNDYLYYIEDSRLNDPKEWADKESYAKIFTANFFKADKSDKSIFVIDYNPLVAALVKIYIEKVPFPKPNKFFCLSFFHDDKATSNMYAEMEDKTINHEMPMDLKFQLIESMLNFPYIKKYEIPVGFTISPQYLTDIINELL